MGNPNAMKTLLLFLVLWGPVVAPAAHAQGLTDVERAQLLEWLTATRKALEGEVRDLSPAQFTHRPTGGGWTVAECLEHLVLVEKNIAFKVREQMLKDLPNAQKNPAVAVAPADLFAQVSLRTQAVKTVETFTPTGQLAGRDAIKSWTDARKDLIDFVKKSKDHLHDWTQPSPVGQLDAVQWLAFLAGHTKRHTEQIRAIKADPKFPKTQQIKEAWNPYGG